jgi:hypothetical protein
MRRYPVMTSATVAVSRTSSGPTRPRRRDVPGLVYLLHLHELYEPYPGAPAGSCAQHYTGFAQGGPRELARRLAQHGTEHGARFLLAARQHGITWVLAGVWSGTRATERALKGRGSARRYCVLCGAVPPSLPLPRNRRGGMARSLLTDAQLATAGLMTSAELAEHTALRRGLVTGRVPGVVRADTTSADDPWYTAAL